MAHVTTADRSKASIENRSSTTHIPSYNYNGNKETAENQKFANEPVERRAIPNPAVPILHPPSQRPHNPSNFQNNQIGTAVLNPLEQRYLQTRNTPANPLPYSNRPPPHYLGPQLRQPFPPRLPGSFDRYPPPRVGPTTTIPEARFSYTDFQNRPQRTPQPSPWNRIRQILPSVRTGTLQSMTSHAARTEAPTTLFDKMAPVRVFDDRETKMGIRRDSVIRSPQPETRRPSVMMPYVRTDFPDPRFATPGEMETSVRRQPQVLAEAAMKTFKNPASEYGAERSSRDAYEPKEDRFLGRGDDNRIERPYDQRPPVYYPNYNYQNKCDYETLNEFGGHRSQQISNGDYGRNILGRNGLWNSKAFTGDQQGLSAYKDAGINNMLNGRNTSTTYETANSDKNEKKSTPNGDIKPPSSLPTERRKEKSLLKTPTKKVSPKSPDRNSPSSLADKKKVPMNKIQVGAAPSPNLREVKSKVGSLDNYTHKPGGGKVKIENRKLEWNAQPRIEAKNDNWAPPSGTKKIPQVKLQWNAKSKIGSLENATHKPGGGDKKIETIKLDFKEKAKPKVGSKDNIKHVPGGGTVKKTDSDAKSISSDIEDQKIEFKAQSKVGSLDNVKHKPGGGDKKIFDDKDYLRQMAATSDNSKINSATTSGSQSPTHS